MDPKLKSFHLPNSAESPEILSLSHCSINYYYQGKIVGNYKSDIEILKNKKASRNCQLIFKNDENDIENAKNFYYWIISYFVKEFLENLKKYANFIYLKYLEYKKVLENSQVWISEKFNTSNVDKWFRHLEYKIDFCLQNKWWLLRDKHEDGIIFASTQNLTYIISGVNKENTINELIDKFENFFRENKDVFIDINQWVSKEGVGGENSDQLLLKIYKTMIYNPSKDFKLQFFICDLDKYLEIKNRLENKIEEENHLKFKFLFESIEIDPPKDIPQISYNFQEETEKHFQYIKQCLNITEFKDKVSKMQNNFEKKLKEKYINTFLGILQDLNNLLENKDKLKKAAAWWTKAISILMIFNENILTKEIIIHVQNIEFTLSTNMKDFVITNLNQHLDVCIQIIIELKVLDEKNKSYFNFENLYSIYSEKYLMLINSIYIDLRNDLKERNIIRFCHDLKNLSENRKILFINEVKDQILYFLVDYFERVWTKFKKANLEQYTDSVHKFFVEMKKVGEVFKYIDFDIDILTRKIIMSKDMQNKIIITKEDVIRWDNLIIGLPIIFKEWQYIFRYWPLCDSQKKSDKKSQPIDKKMKIDKINIDRDRNKLDSIFRSLFGKMNWFGEIICRLSNLNLNNEWINRITSKLKSLENHLNEEQLDELVEAFSSFDKDKRGQIATNKLGTVMRSLGQNPTEAELQDIINKADNNGNGTVDFRKFVEIMSKRLAPLTDPMEEILKTFKDFDRDGSWFITINELKQVVANFGQGISDEEMVKIADSGESGHISYEEFLRMVLVK